MNESDGAGMQMSASWRVALLVTGPAVHMASIGYFRKDSWLGYVMICHRNKCHRPRNSSCHREQRSLPGRKDYMVCRLYVLEHVPTSVFWAPNGSGPIYMF